MDPLEAHALVEVTRRRVINASREHVAWLLLSLYFISDGPSSFNLCVKSEAFRTNVTKKQKRRNTGVTVGKKVDADARKISTDGSGAGRFRV